MDRTTFSQRFERAAARAHGYAQRFVIEQLPTPLRFRIALNSSCDANPLHLDERVFPGERSFDERLLRCTSDEVVQLLWRDGLVPEWIDLSVVMQLPDATLIEALCCGRFTANEGRLYHVREGLPPFHVLSPCLPADETRTRFSVFERAECATLDEFAFLVRHARVVRSLAIHGLSLDAAASARLRAFRGLEHLHLESNHPLVVADWPRSLKSLHVAAPTLLAPPIPAKLRALTLHLPELAEPALARLLAALMRAEYLDLSETSLSDALCEQLVERIGPNALRVHATRVSLSCQTQLARRHPVTQFSPDPLELPSP
jgi:hypothetical protein